MWQNLAQVSRLAALGVERYQWAHSKTARQVSNLTTSVAEKLWEIAVEQETPEAWTAAYSSFATDQSESLKLYRALWTAFDLVRMGRGIAISGSGVLLLLLYLKLISRGASKIPRPLYFAALSKRAFAGSAAGILYTLILWPFATGLEGFVDDFVFHTAFGGIVVTFMYILQTRNRFLVQWGRSSWTHLSILFVLGQTVGFA